jgi:hypothetical protein
MVSLALPGLAAAPPTTPKAVHAEVAAGTSPVTNPPAPAAFREQPAAVSLTPVASQLPDLWHKIIEAVGRVSAFTRSYLLEAHPVSFAKNLLIIGFDPEFEEHIALVDVARNHALLQTKLAEFGYPNVQIKFIKAETPAAWQRAAEPASAPTTPNPLASAKAASSGAPIAASGQNAAVKEKTATIPFSKDDFKNDPLIQKALEVFKGQIVEVRA